MLLNGGSGVRAELSKTLSEANSILEGLSEEGTAALGVSLRLCGRFRDKCPPVFVGIATGLQ